MKKSIVLAQFFLLFLFIGFSLYVIFRYLNPKEDPIYLSSASETPSSCGELTVKVSLTGKESDASNEITMPNTITRYYLHVKSRDGKPCSTAFDVKSIIGSRISESSPWNRVFEGKTYESYYSNNNGIARIDHGKLPNNKYIAHFRPYKSSSIPWSNAIAVNVVDPQVSSASAGTTVIPSQEILAKDYWIQNPGWSYFYKNTYRDFKPDNDASTNDNINTTGKPTDTGKMHLQMEEKVKIGGITAVPWRKVKEKDTAYWAPGLPYTLRWFLADYNSSTNQSSAPSNLPNYKNWIWGLGHQTYTYDDPEPKSSFDVRSSSFNDFSKHKPVMWYIYEMTDTSVPAYMLMPQKATVPYLNSHFKSFYNTSGGIELYSNPNWLRSCGDGSTSCAKDGWEVRMEMDTVSINNSNYAYSGPALRVDYYEMSRQRVNPSKYWILRESWYFVKGVGLVKIMGKTFNNYPNGYCLTYWRSKIGYDQTAQKWNSGTVDCSGFSPDASTDPDFYTDTMSKPMIELSLEQMFKNPTLKVTVANAKSSTYGTTATVVKSLNETYKVQVSPKYTGMLEARLKRPTGVYNEPVKWLYVKDGFVQVDPNLLKGLAVGNYTAQLRPWVPNETYDPNNPGKYLNNGFKYETRVTDTQIPWSNEFTVVMK